MTPGIAILAHQGGWDEISLVAAPIVIIIAILAIVKRRVDAQSDDQHRDPGSPAERS
jgi:hypothetical protein